MDQLIQWLLVPGIFITLVFSILFSWKSRRSTEPKQRVHNAARMNISMGLMLLLIASVQLFLSDESTVRIVIGALFMVIGVFNLFVGLRNLSA